MQQPPPDIPEAFLRQQQTNWQNGNALSKDLMRERASIKEQNEKNTENGESPALPEQEHEATWTGEGARENDKCAESLEKEGDETRKKFLTDNLA